MHDAAMARGAALLLVALLAACTSPTPAPERSRPRGEAPRPPAEIDLPSASPVFGWRCDDATRLVTRYDPVSRGLELAGAPGLERLPAAPSASGARWADAETSFHSRGDEALLRRGEEVVRCAVDAVATADARAAVAGAVFRGLGNEPGWSVTIAPDRIEWVGDYGTVRRSFRAVEVVGSAAETRWTGRDGAGRIEVRSVPAPCVDDGDQSFPARVEVRIDGVQLGGCGRPLAFPFRESGRAIRVTD